MNARGAQTAKHEAAHAAAALALGADVLLVSRRKSGEAEGQVLFRTRTDVEEQAVLLAPLVEMHESPSYVWSHHAYDIIEAKRLGTLNAAVVVAREVARDPEYRRLMRAVENALYSRPVLSRDDIKGVGEIWMT